MGCSRHRENSLGHVCIHQGLPSLLRPTGLGGMATQDGVGEDRGGNSLLCSGPLYESPPDSEEGCTHHSVIELHWGAGGNSCLQTLRADVATLKVTSSFLEEHPVHLHFSLLCRPLWPRTCSSRVPICVSPGPIPRRAAQVGVLREASPLCLLRVLTDDITALRQWLLLCVTFSRVGRHFQLGVPFTCGCDSSPALQVCPVVAATACKGF